MEAANRYNRLSAVRATLLMLGEVFSEDDLLSGVVGLSYIGELAVPCSVQRRLRRGRYRRFPDGVW